MYPKSNWRNNKHHKGVYYYMPTKKQPKPIIISEDDFFEKYQPIINHIARANHEGDVEDTEVAPWGGSMYETFGQELQHITELTNNPKTAKRVWTIVEGDDGEQHVIAGYHVVNRLGYIVTQRAWVKGTEEVEND